METLFLSPQPARKRRVVASARPVSPQINFTSKKVRLRTDTGIDAAATDNAGDESPTKKRASPAKRKGKAATKAASEEEDAPVKSESGDSAGDDA
jgi:hypothetical protein